MPTRLTRYVLFEILKIFLVSLLALTMLILLIGVARELVRRGLGPMAKLAWDRRPLTLVVPNVCTMPPIVPL